ncbi:hypothetical protein THAOC_36213 [Thalassiosira oceanica]|uniref:Uncharacterized protein n=1 Tax=Thalassiosira oceanica TaxID=159749 RepID=K0R271_THAOC|nr:hypothetical protein THAOC_36213 [Thalassiosira oceanica]|eukprot:EJK45184.1 hypothetical protein THAOC_36213 [Thalassiosira oceanica]
MDLSSYYPSTSTECARHDLASSRALWESVESGQPPCESAVITNFNGLRTVVQSKRCPDAVKFAEIFSHSDGPPLSRVVEVVALMKREVVKELLMSIQMALGYDLAIDDPLPGRSVVSTRLLGRCNNKKKWQYTCWFMKLTKYLRENGVVAVLRSSDDHAMLFLPMAENSSDTGDERRLCAARLVFGGRAGLDVFIRMVAPYISTRLAQEEEKVARERAAAKSAADEAAARRKQLKEEAAKRRLKREAEEEAARLISIKKQKHSDGIVSLIGSSPDSSARDSDSPANRRCRNVRRRLETSMIKARPPY